MFMQVCCSCALLVLRQLDVALTGNDVTSPLTTDIMLQNGCDLAAEILK